MPELVVCWNCSHGHHDHCHQVVTLWTKVGDGLDRNGAYFPDYAESTHDCACPDCSDGRLW